MYSSDKNEIRHTPYLLFIGLPILFVLEIVSFLVPGCMVISIYIPVVCLGVVAVYSNVKTTYDETGITFRDVLRKERFVSWEKIVKVEDTFADPHLVRGAPNRIVAISYVNDKGRIETMRYAHSTFTGLRRFVVFSAGKVKC